ncbi:MAG TPA: hypothetical protein VIV40_14540 [Kofleriaceae bacterium]
MMRVLAAALLLAAIGCSSEGTDTPPTLEVTSPARGALADASTVTVTGRVADAEGPVKVTVAGNAVTPAKDGTFTTTVTLDPGVDLIETHAIDSSGNDVRDVRAVLAGSLAPTDGTAAGQVGARAGATALRAVGNAVATSAKAIDYTAAAQALNPVYNNDGCLGAKINITSITLTNVGVGLVPQTGVLATDVTIDNLVVKLAANFKVACIGGSTTITVRASKTKIHGDLALRIATDHLATSLPATSVNFEGFSIDVGGVPGAIESLLRDQAQSGVEKALTSAIKSKVPPIADNALAGLIAKPLTTSLLGHDTTISITPTKVSITPTELFVAVDTKLKVAGGEGGTFLTTATALSPSMMAGSQGLGVALDDDIVNQLFAGLWAADSFDKQVAIDTIPALGALLDDDARTLDIHLSLPPTASTDSGELELALGDLIVTVRDEAGAEVQSMAISITTTLAAEPSQSGKVLLTVGAPTVYATMLAQSAAVEKPLTDEQVEALVTAVWGVIGVKADDALSKLPMPTIGGVTLGAPAISTSTGFVLADMSVN